MADEPKGPSGATDSGIPVDPVVRPDAAAPLDYSRDLGDPGSDGARRCHRGGVG